ncbi:PP2C family protein-serine/threonine phosphatase [Allosediminivita pacifica]|uniref:Serine/threonine protein phosphatase PrpC n=1 Tax=Allosediminivita pacifica TaxID=1267769 RepID=A0A2T6B5T6_9RHOB|nr:PP2C family serine/threonine-protein phosphatase [Allosediminivita pacifica]PTX51430.1 serine/threonine protein phosphatase PrpC [Allosediminivita pacifica]GGA99773.1 hypothetical protein GCM10011324_07510 [Allosediminivita pacifica]
MQSDGSAMGAHKMCFDVASVLWQGARPYQEDSLLQDFVEDGARGYVVLADGMGGHAAGDVASGLAVQTVSRSLGQAIHEGEDFETNIAAHLRAAVRRANRALADEAGGASGTARMGTTLITAILCDARLYWTSVGDSPLYLWREGRLRLLNEDHSMAPVIDRMVQQGELSAEAGRNHPDRNALTSVLSGTEVARIDLSAEGFDLRPDDVLIVASDGLQFLDASRIECILAEMALNASSARICNALLEALQMLDDPHQDNVSICVLRPCGTGMPGAITGSMTRPRPEIGEITQQTPEAEPIGTAAEPTSPSRLRSISRRIKFWE